MKIKQLGSSNLKDFVCGETIKKALFLLLLITGNCHEFSFTVFDPSLWGLIQSDGGWFIFSAAYLGG